MDYKQGQRKFIESWGTLGSSWGINRTMAQIHALLLISVKPLSTEDIMAELNISRGNANMNVRTLMNWGIVKKELKPGERKEFFYSDKDVWELARQVARERKRRELEPIRNALNDLKKVNAGPDEEVKEFKKVVNDLSDFTIKVDKLFEQFIKSDQNWFYKNILKMIR